MERWLTSRGAFFVERLDAVFHPQMRVISQVTCNGRSVDPCAVPDPIVRETSLLLAFLDVEGLSDNWGMPRILGRSVPGGSAESHTHP